MNEQYKTSFQNEDSPLQAFLNILFNIILPVVILDKLSKQFGTDGPLIALIVGLSFPICYFLYEYFKFKKKNIISVLGFVNILFTGGFALLKLEGIWFACKEAFFPFLIGVAVLYSSYTTKPFIKFLIYNPSVLHINILEQRLKEQNTWQLFEQHLKKATMFLSFSFFVSAILNFVLAVWIFQPIDLALAENQRAILLNEQISKMTWMSMVVIVIPSMLMLLLIMRFLAKGIKQYSGLSFMELLVQK